MAKHKHSDTVQIRPNDREGFFLKLEKSLFPTIIWALTTLMAKTRGPKCDQCEAAIHRVKWEAPEEAVLREEWLGTKATLKLPSPTGHSSAIRGQINRKENNCRAICIWGEIPRRLSLTKPEKTGTTQTLS